MIQATNKMARATNEAVQVMIVDDDQATLLLHEYNVKRSRIASDVSKFSRAREAFEYLNAEAADLGPCIIFLDIDMPEMNGWEFLRLLETLPVSVRARMHVVMVSSSIERRDRDKFRRFSSVVKVFDKPLNLQRIEELKKVDVIQHLLTGK